MVKPIITSVYWEYITVWPRKLGDPRSKSYIKEDVKVTKDRVAVCTNFLSGCGVQPINSW